MVKKILLSSALLMGLTTTEVEAKAGFYGKVKLAHALKGKHNGFDSTTGSVYYINLGYESKVKNGFSFNISGYSVGDTGLTKYSDDEKLAKGMFMGKPSSTDKKAATKTKNDLQDFYLNYVKGKVKFRVGHFQLATPMTKDAVSTVPNLYEGGGSTS